MTESSNNQPIWSLYLVRCRDNSLYCGIALDVARRFAEHTGGGRKCARYLRGRGPLQLVFQQTIGTRSAALKQEYRLKQCTKADKERLVAGLMRLADL